MTENIENAPTERPVDPQLVEAFGTLTDIVEVFNETGQQIDPKALRHVAGLLVAFAGRLEAATADGGTVSTAPGGARVGESAPGSVLWNR